jgi:hypothetical protein
VAWRCSISDDTRSADFTAAPMVTNRPLCEAVMMARWNSSAASDDAFTGCFSS